MNNNSEPINGVIYYKLDSTYNGDITKHCGLKSTEIDGNFFFLRGSDIESVEWTTDENANRVLNLIRYNGEKISVNFPEFSSEISIEGSYFDKDKGILHLYINGIDNEIEGFNIQPIETENTASSTGFFAPVKDFLDLTDNITKLPSDSKQGDRYVTKEYISKAGLLYNFAGVQEIIAKLEKENSNWHVPSNEEWGEMLNAIELCDEDRNHISNKSNANLGTYAGALLKADGKGWKSTDAETSISKSYGFKAMPVGGVGISAIQVFSLHINPIQLVGESTEFWTSTSLENSDVWVRRLDYDKDTVKQQAEGTDTFCSLRLINHNISKCHKIETILNKPYNTVIMPSVILNDKSEIIDGNNVAWTVENVSIPVSEGNSIQANSSENESVYFINEWDGTEWVKAILPNYGIVFIESLNKDKRLVNEELIDYSNDSSSEKIEQINDELKSINSKIEEKADKSDVDSLTNSVLSISNKIDKKADKNHAHEIGEINGLSEKISKIGELSDSITEEINRAKSAESEIKDELLQKVEKEDGKTLSSNDYTNIEKAKLENVEEGAQVNKIEIINLNGNPLTITNKSVNITIDESGASEPDIYIGDNTTIQSVKEGKTTTFSVKEISSDKISDFNEKINEKLEALTIDSSKVNGLDEELNKKADIEYVNNQINDVKELIPSLDDYAKTADVEKNIAQAKSELNEEISKKSNSEDVDKIKDSLDTVIDTVGDTEKGLVKDIADVNESVNNTKDELNANISKNADAINEINNKLGSDDNGLIKDVQTLKETVGNEESGLVKKVGELESNLTNLNNKADENQSALENLNSLIKNEENGLLKRTTDNEANISNISSNVKANTSSIAEINKNLSVLETTIIEENKEIQDKISSLNTDNESNKSEIDAIKTNIETINGNISNVETSVSNISSNLGKYKIKDVNTDDKILSINNEGILSSDILLSYDEASNDKFQSKNTIKLRGKNKSIISEIDASDFIKDGMLKEAELIANPDNQAEGTYIHFIFNTDSGSKEFYLNVTSLIDIYTAGSGLNINENVFSIKLKDNESYLALDENGNLISKGIDNAIENAAADKVVKADFDEYKTNTSKEIADVSSKILLETERAQETEKSINNIIGNGFSSESGKTIYEQLSAIKDSKSDKGHTHEINEINGLSNEISKISSNQKSITNLSVTIGDDFSSDNTISTNISNIKANLEQKVDKEEGKGLSVNDYTNDEKEKLKNIEDGAQKNKINRIKIDGAFLAPDEEGVVIIPTSPSGGDSSVTYEAEEPIVITIKDNKRIISLNDTAFNFGEID